MTWMTPKVEDDYPPAWVRWGPGAWCAVATVVRIAYGNYWGAAWCALGAVVLLGIAYLVSRDP